MPTEPEPSQWAFPTAAELDAIEDGEMVGVGADLAPGTLLAAYRTGLFAGESMFHRATDASKVALVHLVELLRGSEGAESRLLDVQWKTDHLETLGVVEISRRRYHRLLAQALTLPLPTSWLV